MKTDEREKMFSDLATTKDADVMDFVMTRKPEVGKTFSADALDEYIQTVQDFIVARIRYHWPKDNEGFDPAKPGPSNIKVELKVTIDDESYPPLAVAKPWYVIDGTNRNLDS